MTRKRKNGNGNAPTCSVLTRTFSPKPSLCHISYRCLKTLVLSSLHQGNVTGKLMKSSSTTTPRHKEQHTWKQKPMAIGQHAHHRDSHFIKVHTVTKKIHLPQGLCDSAKRQRARNDTTSSPTNLIFKRKADMPFM